MSWVFSKRCEHILKTGKLRVSIRKSVRIRLWSLLEKYDTTIYTQDKTGYNYNIDLLEKLETELKSELGLESLLSYPEDNNSKARSSNLSDFVLRGNYPPYLLDAIELFFDSPIDNKEEFQKEFNQIMEESNLQWRMANGKIFPVDSSYIDEFIIQKTYFLVKQVKFYGALQEFEKARVDLINGDFSGAIQNAYLAFESTKKGVLNVTKIKPGDLTRKLIDSGIVPEYYTGFLQSFEDNILRAPDKMRNDELGSGHGQGKEINNIPKSFAELAINLSAVLINFLIKRYLEINSKETVEEPETFDSQYKENDDDIPF